MSESDIWSVFMVNGPISGLFCWPGVLPEDAEAVRSLVSRGLPLPIVPARLVVEGSGLVSRSSSDWDFLGVVVALFDFLFLWTFVWSSWADPSICWLLLAICCTCPWRAKYKIYGSDP